jgi:pyruvate/2-oxoglutarate dehydrogenase complex dihydrolipoamide acyltransferase (E2) component
MSAHFQHNPPKRRHSRSWHVRRLSPGSGIGANHDVLPLFAARCRPHGRADAAHDPSSGAAPSSAHPLSIGSPPGSAQTPGRRPAATPASAHALGEEGVDGAAGAGAHRPGGRAVRECLSSDRLSGGQTACDLPAHPSPWPATPHRGELAHRPTPAAKSPPGQTAPRCRPRHRQRDCRLRRHRFPIGRNASRRTVPAALPGSTHP